METVVIGERVSVPDAGHDVAIIVRSQRGKRQRATRRPAFAIGQRLAPYPIEQRGHGWPGAIHGEPRSARKSVAAAPDGGSIWPVRSRRIPRPLAELIADGGEQQRPLGARQEAKENGAHADHGSVRRRQRGRAVPRRARTLAHRVRVGGRDGQAQNADQVGTAPRSSRISDGVRRLPARDANSVISYAADARSTERSVTTPSTEPLPSALISRYPSDISTTTRLSMPRE